MTWSPGVFIAASIGEDRLHAPICDGHPVGAGTAGRPVGGSLARCDSRPAGVRSATSSPTESDPMLLILILIVVVLFLAYGGYFGTRRRRRL